MGLMTINVGVENNVPEPDMVSTVVVESTECSEKLIMTLSGDNYYYQMTTGISGVNVSAEIIVKDSLGNTAPSSGFLTTSGIEFHIELISFISPVSTANETSLVVSFSILDAPGGNFIGLTSAKRISTNLKCFSTFMP